MESTKGRWYVYDDPEPGMMERQIHDLLLDDFESSVSPAQLHPHPHRLPPPSLPFFNQKLPLFEKSNVLVL